MYAVMFTAVLAAYALYALWRYLKPHEKFTEGPALGAYEAKMYVMSVFDTALHRKPTEAEIAKYSKYGSESKILAAVVTDFSDVISECADDSDAEAAAATVDDKEEHHDEEERHDKGEQRKGEQRKGEHRNDAVVADADSDCSSDSKSAPAPASRAPPAPYAPRDGELLHDCEEDAGDDPGVRRHPPSSHHHHHRRGGRGGGGGGDEERVYLDKADVLARLRTISHEVKQFTKMVELM